MVSPATPKGRGAPVDIGPVRNPPIAAGSFDHHPVCINSQHSGMGLSSGLAFRNKHSAAQHNFWPVVKVTERVLYALFVFQSTGFAFVKWLSHEDTTSLLLALSRLKASQAVSAVKFLLSQGNVFSNANLQAKSCSWGLRMLTRTVVIQSLVGV